MRYQQFKDYTVRIDQEDYTKDLYESDFELPAGLRNKSDKEALDSKGLKCLRGINGSLQWLVTNTRVDLAAKVSLSASATSNPTVDDLRKANKLVRQAQRDSDLPLYFHPIPRTNSLSERFQMQLGQLDQMALPKVVISSMHQTPLC